MLRLLGPVKVGYFRLQLAKIVRVVDCNKIVVGIIDMLRKSLNCIIMGAPGGGKGTISKKLVKDFGFVHVSMHLFTGS
jgi:hypothetical protein